MSQPNILSEIQNYLINSIQQTNNFGYKIITSQQIKIIQNWFRVIHNDSSIDLNGNVIQFFGSSMQLVFKYIIAGYCELNSQNSYKIVYFNSIYQSVAQSLGINKSVQSFSLNIDYMQNEQNKVLKKLQDLRIELNNEQYTFVVVNNPDLRTGHHLSQQTIEQLTGICDKNKKLLIINEILIDLHPQNVKSAVCLLKKHSNKNIIVIRQLGSVLLNITLSKFYCIYSNKQLKQKCTKITSKYIKMLPSELTINLIKCTMAVSTQENMLKNDGFFYRQQIIKKIKQNYTIIFNFVKLYLNKNYVSIQLENICKSQYFVIIQKRQDTQVYQILKYLEFQQNQWAHNKQQKQFMMDLSVINTKQLINKIQKIKNTLLKAKL